MSRNCWNFESFRFGLSNINCIGSRRNENHEESLWVSHQQTFDHKLNQKKASKGQAFSQSYYSNWKKKLERGINWKREKSKAFKEINSRIKFKCYNKSPAKRLWHLYHNSKTKIDLTSAFLQALKQDFGHLSWRPPEEKLLSKCWGACQICRKNIIYLICQ